MADFRDKLKGWDLLLKTCFNFIRFYTLLETVKDNRPTDEAGQPVPPREINLTGLPGDPERTVLYNLLRSELDNVDALIALLRRSNPAPLILAGDPAEEDVFSLSPDLISQLEMKKKLMLDHWLDLDELLRRPNW